MNNNNERDTRVIRGMSPELAAVELIRIDGAIKALISSMGEEVPPSAVMPSDRLNFALRLLAQQRQADELDLPQVLEIVGAAAKMFNLFT